ncbi:pilus assembly protein TadB [Saccharopolyspora rhizosphaerae]|uniref:Pilus assembly protein TadB n=1 Tax=Saccharopolyspora rhizosphaerae TaxID=2492662 RepID=A0A3R8P5W9_9PSEU|nr:pilus assembly protein TadB [Saccharopolyspora rhizosphaerae]RRO17056.1 pilus assembly protein TadB [Saccharopolyspora rhizosphaerae]
MTPTLGLAALVGALLGIGLAAGVRSVVGPAPMGLQAALHHLTHPTTAQHRHLDRLIQWAQQAGPPWLAIPEADLDLLERTPRSYVSNRITWGLSAGLAGLVLAMGFVAAGTVSLLVAPVLVLGCAAAGAWVPVWRTRDAARHARSDARRVLAVYLDLVAQERAAGQAPGPALHEAAALTDHPLLQRLHHTLVRAENHGYSPWDALRGLGEQVRLDELVTVADLAATAADGAAIYASLTAQAASLRATTTTEDKAEANARTERLTLPVTALMAGFLLLALYPTVARLLIG